MLPARTLGEALLDYARATQVAAADRWERWPAALMGVVFARLRYRIGPRYHSLFCLGRQPIGNWRAYILDRYSNPLVRAVNGHENIALARDKIAFATHCLSKGLPTIPLLGVIDRRSATAPAGVPRIESATDLAAMLSRAPARVFVKLIDGAHGAGAFVAEREDDAVWRFTDRRGSAADVYRFAVDRLGARRGWIFQPCIEPHPDLQALMTPGALGTVRAITYAGRDGPRLLLPVLRIPAGGNVTDNFSEGSAGNIVAPIDAETGLLGAGRMSRTTSWPDIVEVPEHPDTGAVIAGTRMPHWQAAVHLMLRAQRETPTLRTIGWDIAITRDGPLIVEANTGYDVNLLQVAYRRGVRQELQPVYSMANS